MRLFFALNFSNNTKARLVSLQDELRLQSVGGNFTAPENLHLTLAFLGECSPKQLISAKIALNLMKIELMNIQIDCLGCFRRDAGDIWWAGVAENDALMKLQRELSNKLISVGFKLDNRKYNPHITLARDITVHSSLREIEPFDETILEVELMKSERMRGKMVYTAVHVKTC